MKVAKLQDKIKKIEHNNTAMNLDINNESQISLDQRVNVSAF